MSKVFFPPVLKRDRLIFQVCPIESLNQPISLFSNSQLFPEEVAARWWRAHSHRIASLIQRHRLCICHEKTVA